MSLFQSVRLIFTANSLGSKLGRETIARISPVCGFSTITEHQAQAALEFAKAALDEGIRIRCHVEDVTRADFYGFVVPLAIELMKLRASYNSGTITAPTSVICKIGRPLPASLGSTSPFERERRAYVLFGQDPGFRIPRAYFNASDGSGLCNLLLEDLSATARAGDQIAGCSLADAAAVVRELARFHSRWKKKPGLAADTWMSRPQQLLPAYTKGAAVIADWLADRLPAEDLAVVHDFDALAERWLAQPAPRLSLIHGDPRVDNILFEETPDGTRACLIDWQSLGLGDPQYDVAYFLSGSVSPDDRRAGERDLLAEYVRIVAKVDPDYTLELALASYRANIVSGLWLTVIAAAYIERNDHNANLLVTLVTRNASAVRDWGGFGAITAGEEPAK